MQYKRKLRCPECDGAIELKRNDESYYTPKGEYVLSHIQSPVCVQCGTAWQIKLNTEGILDVTFARVGYYE